MVYGSDSNLPRMDETVMAGKRAMLTVRIPVVPYFWTITYVCYSIFELNIASMQHDAAQITLIWLYVSG